MINKVLKLCLVVLVVFTVLGVFFQGCFVDGLVYSSISRNLAGGAGSWFDLQYTQTLGAHFTDNVPFFYWLESLFFAVFGDHFWTEKVFCAVLFLLSLFSLFRIGKILGLNNNLCFILLFLVAVNPRMNWVFSNNMVECLLVPLVLLFVWVELVRNSMKVYWHIVLQSLIVSALLLTKGPNGLFILGLLPIKGLVEKEFWVSTARFFSIVLVSFGILFCMYWFIDGFHQYANAFFSNQLVRSLLSERESSDSHFTLFESHLNDLLFPLLLILLFLVLKWMQKTTFDLTKKSIVFLLTGLLQPLPFLLSTKQQDYYFVVWYPLFYIWLVMVFKNQFRPISVLVSKVVDRMTELWKSISLAILCVVFICFNVWFYGEEMRDKDRIKDVAEVAFFFKDQLIIPSEPEVIYDWSIPGYLQRNHKISLAEKEETTNDYVLSKKKTDKTVLELNNCFINNK